jgi:hypothetical protein
MAIGCKKSYKPSTIASQTFTVIVGDPDADAVAADIAELDLSDIIFGLGDSASNVTQDFTLPTTGPNGTTISWESNNDTVSISGDTATVTIPSFPHGDTSVILTATVSLGDANGTTQFTITVIASSTTEIIKHASDAQLNDLFGYGVGISGDYAIVGAYQEGGGIGDPAPQSGAAYIYERDAGGTWNEADILHASDAQPGDYFGYSVAISGNYAIAGANLESGGAGDPYSFCGAAYIFERDGIGNWNEVENLHPSDAADFKSFGKSVAISGDYAIVGAAGSATSYIFERDVGGSWNEVEILTASDGSPSDGFGWSVSISGNYAIVGAPNENGGPGDPLMSSGTTYIFERDGVGNWNEVEILRVSDAQEQDNFGTSVSIYGDYAIVGADSEDGGAILRQMISLEEVSLCTRIMQ